MFCFPMVPATQFQFSISVSYLPMPCALHDNEEQHHWYHPQWTSSSTVKLICVTPLPLYAVPACALTCSVVCAPLLTRSAHHHHHCCHSTDVPAGSHQSLCSVAESIVNGFVFCVASGSCRSVAASWRKCAMNRRPGLAPNVGWGH